MNEFASTGRCPACGAELPATAPQGLCPRCLLLEVAAPTDPGDDPGGMKPAAPSIERLAEAFPQLEILGLIGQGGMGCVFRARQSQLERVVALKILPESLAADPKFAERFTREARALASLNHPHIVTVHDFGRAGEFYYLLMEHVDGVNLREALRAGRFTPEQALAIVPPLCDALQYAHDRGVVHRDIKPENILLDRTGAVKVADFGIARMVASNLEPETGAAAPAPEMPPQAAAVGANPAPTGLTGEGMAGTPGYMAPEQRGDPQRADHRADIYSLGVVFYEMLTGKPPSAQLEPPSSRLRGMRIDVRLDEVVLRALERDPARRYQQVSELKTAVETVVTSSPTTSPDREASSPVDTAPPAIASIEEARRALKRPAMGMLVMGAITPLLPAVLVLTGVLAFGPWIHWLLLFTLPTAGLMILGALSMRSLASRRQAMAGVIAGFAVSFFNLACLPFCIWGLAVLSRDPVRAAFRDEPAPDTRRDRMTPVALATLGGLVVGLSTLMSAWLFVALMPDSYLSLARVAVTATDAPDGHPGPLVDDPHSAFDPYLLQTEFEKLRSMVVLQRVIEELDLNQRWGQAQGSGEPLQTADTYRLLQRRMDLRHTRDTHLLEIRVWGEDPREAADVANAIARHYQQVHQERQVQIVDRAEPDPRPSRPNRYLGIFLGAVLAVLLGSLTSGLTLLLATRRRLEPGLGRPQTG